MDEIPDLLLLQKGIMAQGALVGQVVQVGGSGVFEQHLVRAPHVLRPRAELRDERELREKVGGFPELSLLLEVLVAQVVQMEGTDQVRLCE